MTWRVSGLVCAKANILTSNGLIRRARPAEDFLNLCARQGQKRLSVGGRLVDATSYQIPGPYPLDADLHAERGAFHKPR